ncbi:MAG TPA: hypothetical protein PKY78_04075 [Candidatus Omnitrophota bacterium]|nr:hypothetical protein [Candidatus Omnitrophota bacterium]HPS20147.1 hypothetical protein [Candidatus Omnitrophota bacterium]
MKELIYKTIEGLNPRKREVSIEENDPQKMGSIGRKWICKYFVKSFFVSRTREELEKWLSAHNHKLNNVRNCHIMKKVDTCTGKMMLLCKVIGEFYVVKELAAYKVMYVNSLKITMDNGAL